MAMRLEPVARVADASAGGHAVLRASSAERGAEAALGEIGRAFGDVPLALAMLFVSARHDREAVAAAAERALPGVTVIGATTAGEIGPEGYQDGTIVALGFPSRDFACTVRLIRPLSGYSLEAGAAIAGGLLAARGAGRAADWPHDFVLMLVDGLSRREDALVASLAPALGPVPLVGGSAGDGLDFGASFVLAEGAFHADAAVLAHLRSRCPVRTLRIDHFEPTDKRMVVTGADPAERVVTEINAEPAAREYARLIGLDRERLSPFVFAENPLLVRVSGHCHVRAIQQAEPDDRLRFYSAIDEGLVLTLARAEDIVEHLDGALSALSAGGCPDLVLAFDCVLRRLEVEKKQARGRMSGVLRRHGLHGFNTYGEQYGAMHVNQTLTGVAIYPAPGDAPADG